VPIKVFHVFQPSLNYRFGGQSIWWMDVLGHWDDAAVMHSVLESESGRMINPKEAFHFEFTERSRTTSRPERLYWIIDLFRNLIRFKGQYDILHVHVLWWGGLLIGPWARWNNIPTIYESVLLDSDTPGAILKEKMGCIKLRCLKDYRAILAISETLASDYLKHGFSNEQVFTLPNCVDLELFAPIRTKDEKEKLRLKLNLPVDATILVFVGSVIERKGADVLVHAFLQARTRYPDLFLLVVGPRNKNENPSLDEDFVAGLHTLIEKEGVSERVSFAGLIQDRQALAEIYRAADIFVFPSRQEGLGNVVLEAMATGLPVAVSQLPVLDKIILDGENGLVAPIGDAEATSIAILRICGDPDLAARLGSNARTTVEKKHGFTAWQRDLVDMYRSLTAQPGKKQ
jgi:glycosyltransferase involved in cell wall biosynthesis